MRRLLSALLCLLLLLTAAGCGSTAPASGAAADPSEKPEPAAAEAEAPPSPSPSPTPTPAPTPTPEPTSVPIQILDRTFASLDEEIDLTGMTDEDAEAVADALRKMPALRLLHLGEQRKTPLTWDSITLLHEAAPAAEIDYEFHIKDRYLNLRDEVLDLRYVRMEDDTLARQIAACMVNLKTLDMDGCCLPNETMAALRDDMPDVEVIWRVNFGRYYSVRTNVERILASMPGKAGNLVHNNVKNLQYCTKVKYLDLGHNNYLDTIEFVRYMPDLEVAILALNCVEDFSPLADCPKLEYLELFNTHLHDLRPLAELKNLKHLNICFNFAIRDISPLYGLTQLERLWIGKHCPVSPEQIAEMQRCAPNCEINTTAPDPTEEGWRAHKNPDGSLSRYEILRRQFGYQESDFAYYWNDPYYSSGAEAPEPDDVKDFVFYES